MRSAVVRASAARAMLAVALVCGGVLAYFLISASNTRDRDLRLIDAKFHAITCDSLRREVASRRNGVEAATLFANHSPSGAIRAYYKKGLPDRRAAHAEALTEYAKNCPKEAKLNEKVRGVSS